MLRFLRYAYWWWPQTAWLWIAVSVVAVVTGVALLR